ncbi:hypothetical protein [Streptomyces sp. A5-4]|uniref:hypothetical protein n=1 Tax=Streptomyces sp. A5-4 TaxID=3384771 RepID=UPI003DA80FB5
MGGLGNRTPAPSWFSIARRERDDRLLEDAHAEPYDGGELDWPSCRAFAAAQADPQLPMAGLARDLHAHPRLRRGGLAPAPDLTGTRKAQRTQGRITPEPEAAIFTRADELNLRTAEILEQYG